MSKFIASAAIRGAHQIVERVERKLNEALETYGPNQEVEFPNTGYYLPIIYGILGVPVKTLGDMKPVLERAKALLPPFVEDRVWLPYLGHTLDAGMATFFAEEIEEALKYLQDPPPYLANEPNPIGDQLWLGAANDVILRERGIQFVDGTAPGFAAIVGAAPDNETAVKIARELQQSNLYVFMSATSDGKNMAEQLHEAGIQMGWETRLVPFGRDLSATVFSIGFATRAAMSFGGIEPGDYRRILRYNKDRIFAFAMALGPVDDEKFANAAGAINWGFPAIADTDITQILPSGVCTYEHVVSPVPHDQIVKRAIEVRGLKVQVSKVDVPVPFGPAFEGEVVRREDMYVQFGGKYTTAFEFLYTRSPEEVEDHRIEVIGPDVDTVEEGGALPLGIIVEVAGREMQTDFEPILERRIHTFINEASGIWHMGQRDMNWLRISKEAFKAGFRLRHFGEILWAQMHAEFGAIVDKVQVTIYTNQADVERWLPEAQAVYRERDERIAGMTDESVETFYSCTLCQSFAPNHVCIISPERLGLCGAYNYLDGAASYRLNPTGPNQPVEKGRVIDPIKGQWEGVNAFVYEKSRKSIERFNAYSMMEDPMTSCLVGDTEVIIDNQVVRIGDFIDAHRGGDEYAKSRALTLNGGKAAFEPIVAMQRFPAPERLIRLRTKSGVNMTLTPNHEVAVDRPEGLHWVRADQMREGDRVISIRRLALEAPTPDMVDLLPDDFRIRDEAWIGEIKERLSAKYGSLAAACRHLEIRYPDPRVKSLPLWALKVVVADLGDDWEEVKQRITTVACGASVISLPREPNADLFYLLGLLASDGSISKRGPHEYRVDFVNTDEALIEEFRTTYQRVFPDQSIGVRQRKAVETLPEINGRSIHSAQDCFQCYCNNPLLGVLCEHYGIKVGANGKWALGNMLSLPEELIAAFLTGVFDGDGSARIRRYDGQWEVSEAYIGTTDEEAARHLQLLLKRLEIVGHIREDRSVWRVELHGSNVRRFAETIGSRHPAKKSVLETIRMLSTDDRLDKTQTEVLPFSVGKAISAHEASHGTLSESTRYYYETGRSRPVASNVRKVMAASGGDESLAALLDTDYFLDTVTGVEEIRNHGQFEYVYNLTLADTHCYFVNGGPLAKNCGCFECIVALIPEANGVMIVNREYPGDTPAGMRFTTLAGSVGGGLQTPGFIGVGRLYITSKKFISADGGLPRIVWMPKELKEAIRERLVARCEEIGMPDLPEKIADETVATTSEELLAYLEQVGHPALTMDPMF